MEGISSNRIFNVPERPDLRCEEHCGMRVEVEVMRRRLEELERRVRELECRDGN
jgi:hypothetical protein